MAIEEFTLALFAACNSARVVAYVPQILKAAADKNGASSISCTTWTLFLIAHVSTVAYALVSRADWGLAACFAGNTVCCVAILAVAYRKRRDYGRRALVYAGPPGSQCADLTTRRSHRTRRPRRWSMTEVASQEAGLGQGRHS
jgi:hypothetical protein